MIKGLSEYEKFKVIRPIIGGCDYDAYHMPIIKSTNPETIRWEDMIVQGVHNLSSRKDNSNTLALMFLDDKKLLSYWNAPLKKIALFTTCLAVATPDFSVYPTMNPNDIQHNVYMNRWLGVTWQNYGVTVFPTVGWASENTYDVCFSAIEEGTPVVISTLGCQKHQQVFLKGFREMKKRIHPPIIVVFGNMIKGMTGTFINFSYADSFSQKYTQLKFDGISSVFTIKEEM